MKRNYFFSLVVPAIFLVAPTRCVDYVDNSRIFVEGKITKAGTPVANDSIILYSELISLSKGVTKQDGTFKLGGAGTNAEKYLRLGKKIRAINTSVPGCMIVYDSTAVMIPENISYVKFNNIELAR